jgi:cell division topological specificity factor
MSSWFTDRKKSNEIAKERLKIVLIHDRAGTSPNSNILEMIKKDIVKVISNYIDIDEQEFDVEMTRGQAEDNNHIATKLVANIPIKRIKDIGRNNY